MKRILPLLTLVALLLTACNSSQKFTKRKYTKGYYVSSVPKKKSVSSHDSKQIKITKPAVHENHPDVRVSKIETNMVDEKPVQKINVADPGINSKRPAVASADRRPLWREGSAIKPLSFLKKKNQQMAKPELAPGDHSNVGVILSGLGVLLDITGIYVAFFTLQYFFVAFTIAGFVLGLIGLLTGIKGMSNYKREKKAGTKYTKTLVMSIISMALGAGAMVLGLVYTLFGLLVVSSF